MYYNLSIELSYKVLSKRLRIKEICGSEHSMNKSDILP
jgi:hypothetical protein